MRRPKVYLETTMFNYYFDANRDAHADTVRFFKETEGGKYQPFTSTYAIEEMERAPKEKSDKMIALISAYNITVLRRSEEADKLAKLYLEQSIMPPRCVADASHVAVATVNDMDIILSLNFEHIVRRKTVLMTGNLNIQLGYKPIEIRPPMEVVNRDDG